MKRYIIALVFGVISFAAFAQQEQFVSLEIDRIFVKNGDRFSYSLEWDEYEAKKMGLIQRHKQYPYEVGSGCIRYFDHSWWSWEDEYITKTTITDGSIKSSYQSSYISVSVNLHPQWLILSIKNLTSNYLVLDLNLGLVSVSPPEPNLKNRKYDVETSMVTLENYYGSKSILLYCPLMQKLMFLTTINYGNTKDHLEMINTSSIKMLKTGLE